MKKAELHVHLEGCVWEKHKIKWREKAINFFPFIDSNLINFPISFEDFLAILRSSYNYLNGEAQYISVLNDYLHYMQEQNIVYAEIQINSALLRTFNIDIMNLLRNFNKEVQSRKKQVIRYIIDLPWQFSAHSFEYFIKNYDQFKELGVVGLSMGGDESFARPSEIVSIFDSAKKVGYKILCHAGETTNTNFAKKIIEELNPDRIGHGLSLADWFISQNDKTFIIDTCLTSNHLLGLVKNIDNHPFQKWILSNNVITTLSTDDPAIFNTTLKREYNLAENHFLNMDCYFDNIEDYYVKAAFDKAAIHQALYY